MNTLPANIEWSRNIFRILRDGGGWGVPRSGLTFTRRGSELHLTARMPHNDEMPVSAAVLHEQQKSDFDVIKENFEAGGIPVIDATK